MGHFVADFVSLFLFSTENLSKRRKFRFYLGLYVKRYLQLHLDEINGKHKVNGQCVVISLFEVVK